MVGIIPKNYLTWTNYYDDLKIELDGIKDCFKKYHEYNMTLAYLKFSARIIRINNIELNMIIDNVINKLNVIKIDCMKELKLI